MPPREFIKPRAKREELKTYRELTLRRDLKSKIQRKRVEALTYAQLAEESCHEAQRHVPVAALGRALTTEEQRHFAASRAASEGPARRANQASHTALDHVLGSIEQRQTHNPARYQTVWAQLVGADAAQQSQLDQVDPNTQTAYFRCYNSVLSTDLQRRRGLAQKLARELGLPVRQLRAKF